MVCQDPDIISNDVILLHASTTHFQRPHPKSPLGPLIFALSTMFNFFSFLALLSLLHNLELVTPTLQLCPCLTVHNPPHFLNFVILQLRIHGPLLQSLLIQNHCSIILFFVRLTGQNTNPDWTQLHLPWTASGKGTTRRKTISFADCTWKVGQGVF